jgi:hypothetical protein
LGIWLSEAVEPSWKRRSVVLLKEKPDIRGWGGGLDVGFGFE